MVIKRYGLGGVLVDRGLISPVISVTAFEELMEVRGFFPGTKNKYPGIEQYSSKVDLIRVVFPHVGAILDTLKVTDEHDSVNINFQIPNAEQKFHIDNPAITMRAGMIAVVHLFDEGAFDFSINAGTVEEAIHDFERIEPLGVGDVVYQLDKFVPHRGVNLGSDTRITLGIPLPYSF